MYSQCSIPLPEDACSREELSRSSLCGTSAGEGICLWPRRLYQAEVSVIVPTLNEADNIPLLIPRIEASLRKAGIQGEILIADGGSTDGTRDVVRSLVEDISALRLVQSDGKGGLAGDVIRVARMARGKVVVVMDGDLSHPPETLGELLRPLLNDQCDMTIGSRYVAGGSSPDWPWHRRMISKAGAWLASLITDVADPMSGFFAVRRGRIADLGSEVRGFKIGLELLACGGDGFRVREIPIEFTDRERGQTKFGPRQTLEYGQQLTRLTGGHCSTGSALRWIMVGLLGMGLDLGLFALLHALGFSVLLAHTISFIAATLLNFILNWKWAFRDPNTDPSYLSYLVTCMMAYFLRAGAIMVSVQTAGVSPYMAIAVGIALAAGVNYIGSAWFVFGRPGGLENASVRWRVLALAVVAYSIVVRLVYAGCMDLIPEEAYYWNYSQHLAWGYLDHPPMVAWMIRLGTWLAGNSELAVRLPGIACWMLSAWLMWKHARLLFDKTTAYVAVALMASLPVMFLTGYLTTPDTFLILFWTGAMYTAHLAILLNRRKAWYALGVLVGLGLLSKYTMALLGLALLVFLVWDQRGRHWWRRREPYLAVLLAVLVFMPVLLWNAQNEWVSFTFQSSRRLAKKVDFGLFTLLGSMVVLVTPLGVIGSIRGLLPGRWSEIRPRGRKFSRRSKRLSLLLFAVPMAVFVLFSLTHSPKTNWTSIAFLSAVPFLARDIVRRDDQASAIVAWGRRAWRPVLIGLVMLMGFLGFYSAAAFPGLTPVDELDAYGPSVWAEFNQAVEQIRERVSAQTGESAALVGMDKYFISSEMAFYDRVNRWPVSDDRMRVAGRGLFPDIFAGDRGLMWATWAPREAFVGRPILLVSFTRDNLEIPDMEEHFDSMSAIQRQGVVKDGRLITAFYWRVGYDYRSDIQP